MKASPFVNNYVILKHPFPQVSFNIAFVNSSFLQEEDASPSVLCSNTVHILTVLDVMLGTLDRLKDSTNIEYLNIW